jgi:hypothetical protein
MKWTLDTIWLPNVGIGALLEGKLHILKGDISIDVLVAQLSDVALLAWHKRSIASFI